MNKFISINVFVIYLCLFPLIKLNERNETLNTSNGLNFTYIKEKIKIYEKDYFDLFIKSSRNEELFCDKIRNNIHSFKEIKNRFSLFQNDMSKDLINDEEFKEFLNIMGDISFSKRNIDIIIEKLKKKEKSCINNYKEFENIKNDLKGKSSNNKENIV